MLIAFFILLAFDCEATIRLLGHVLDENNVPVANARAVVISSDTMPAGVGRQETLSDVVGDFKLDVQSAGTYRISVEREGFFKLSDQVCRLEEGDNDITFILSPIREVFESIDVTFSPPAIDYDQTNPEDHLNGTEIISIPYRTSHNLKNAMRVLPGTVQDAAGAIHIKGAREEQILFTLDGFTLNDPYTGRFESRLSVESVRSMELSTGNLPAEFGKGVAGVMTFQTSSGDNKFRYTATDFLPNIQYQKGLTLKEWSPRVNFSGPIIKNRSWFSNSYDSQYITNIVPDLPKGEDRTGSARFSNLLRSQTNLSASNILYGSFLVNIWTAPRADLSALIPPETTTDRRSRLWFLSVKDQVYLKRNGLLEVGFAANRTFDRQIPQGHELLTMTVDGLTGNSFIDAVRHGGRDQLIASLLAPPFDRKGSHQLRFGLEMARVSYSQNVQRTGFEQLRADQTLSRYVTFEGSGQLRVKNLESSVYLEDVYKPMAGLLFQVGLRQDWDSLIGNNRVYPRFGFSWNPPGMEQTKLSGGYALVRGVTNLYWFAHAADQFPVQTNYDRLGQVSYGPVLRLFSLDRDLLTSPRSENITVEIERRLRGEVYASVGYLRRRVKNALTYTPFSNGVNPLAVLPGPGQKPFTIDTVYYLTNDRMESYDGVTLALKQTFHKQLQWFFSYTRSRAYSNAVIDFSPDDLQIVHQNAGPMPWDSPNRFLSWGFFPLFGNKWMFAYLVDQRTGFPFSVINSEGDVVGGVNSNRLPSFFELNVHAERRFVWRKQRWAFRAGVNNLTNHHNPTLANYFVDSPNFLAFYGSQSRTFNFRLRWLSKE